MKFGVGISLGTLLNPTLLTWAAELRAAGVEHCCYANAPVDTIAVANKDTAAMEVWSQKVGEQLAALKTMGMSVGVRPRPMILEQVVLETTKTPNFIASNTSLRAVKLLQPELCPGGVVIQHEAADTSNLVIRGWAVRELLPHVGIIYYGRHGMVGQDGGPGYGYGADFGPHDLPHIVYVALNAAGAGDASAAGQSNGPADCTAKDIRLAAERFDRRLQEECVFGGEFGKHVHINVLADTPVPMMKDMLYAAAIGCRPDVVMLRSVFGKNDPRGPEGNTLTDPANPQRHWVTPNVLQAIKECAAWMT
jgi:hypothetical protein